MAYNTGDQNRFIDLTTEHGVGNLSSETPNSGLVRIGKVTAFTKDRATCATTLRGFELEKLEWGSHRAARQLKHWHYSGEAMEFSIRMVRAEDAESIVELLNPIIQAGTYTIMDEQPSVDDQIDFMRGFPKRGVFNVAVCNDSQKVLGLQDVQPISTGVSAFRHFGEISTFVSLASHRNGIGGSLSHATFIRAKEQGFLKLSATIRADNPQAALFYQSLGFKVIGTARKHASVVGKYIDEILMEKFID